MQTIEFKQAFPAMIKLFFFKETLPVLEHQSSHFLREHFPYQDLSTVSESFRMFFKLVTLITNRSWSKKCHSTSIHMKTCTKTAPESTPNKQLPRNKCFFAYSVSWCQVPSTELLLVDKFSTWGARPQFKHLTTGDVQYARIYIYIYIGYTDMKLYIHEVSANHHCSYFKSCRLGQFYDMSLMQLQATSSWSWNYRKSQNPKPPTLQPFSTLLALASKDSFPSYRTPPKTFLESTVVLPKPQKFMGNVGSEVQRYMTVKLGRCNIRRPKYKQNTQRNTLPWRDSNDAM